MTHAELNEKSLKKHAFTAFVAVTMFLGGLTWWAQSTEVAGAVLASGKVVVDDRLKTIQHLSGGVIKEIPVRNGQKVNAGDTLLVLDTGKTQAALTGTTTKYREALIRRARLRAQVAGAPSLELPTELASVSSDPLVVSTMTAQNQALAAHAESQTSQSGQVNQQVNQLGEQIRGLELQREGASTQLAELRKNEKILNDTKTSAAGENFSAALSEVRIQIAGLESQRATFEANISQLQAAVAEQQLRADQLVADAKSESIRELELMETSVSELSEKLAAEQGEIDLGTLKAPVSGSVHESTVETIGGVVLPGQTVMTIVPDTALSAEVRISPQNIDSIHADGSVRVRLSGFDQRTTPEIPAKILRVSPDATTDELTGESHFIAAVELSEAANLLPPTSRLVPGMPVKAYILTRTRTVMDYLLQPLHDQIERAFREE